METRFQKFIAKRKVALIGSVDDNGYPNTKAMLAPRKIDGNVYYFSTNTSSMRVSQFRTNPKACLYFFRKGLFRYEGIMLTGVMEVLTDAPTKEMIWKTGDTVFYKGGVTDPDYCVLKFTAEKARRYCDLTTQNLEL